MRLETDRCGLRKQLGEGWTDVEELEEGEEEGERDGEEDEEE